ESLLDHILMRAPRAWAREWERAPQALRTAQGCLTSEQWFDETELKLRAPLGRRAHFGLDLRQNQGDRVRYQYLDFSFHFPTRFGTAVAMFRPFYDKSRQDFAAMWDVGSDTSAFQLRVIAGFEDLFNNIWEFRQSRVGGLSEPYLRHPYEPALRLVVRQPWLRAELGGRYLTPSSKRVINSYADESLNRIRTLWGTLAWASVEASALGLEWEVRSTNHQATSSDAPSLQPQPDGRDYRRQWSVETAARRRLVAGLTAEARWLYQGRTQTHAPPVGPRTFDAVDRVIQLEALWSANSRLALRVGGLHDRITVTQAGNWPSIPYGSYGTRKESRAYVGLIARFGRVSVQGVEGIELDREPYDVAFIHDKGFLQLQTTF
ncbi:MAG: hypothetical protein AAB113_11135, partial [Candidatus Eisenbacteria bacterium]